LSLDSKSIIYLIFNFWDKKRKRKKETGWRASFSFAGQLWQENDAGKIQIFHLLFQLKSAKTEA
jgi:hypothetical protein